MKHIRPVSTEEVQAAYMPVTDYVDESGFNPDDMRHPRWLHPVVPEGRAPGELEKALDVLGIEWEAFGGIDGVRASFDSDLILVGRAEGGRFYVPRWPDKSGEYGVGSAPQYCIRNDSKRYDLPALLEFLKQHGKRK